MPMTVEEAINQVSVAYEPAREAAIAIIPDGLCLEIGVSTGRYTRVIAEMIKPRTYYGFDSFEGLPERWNDESPAGSFKCDPPNDLPANVELVIGMFQNTLKPFLERNQKPVAWVHFDADLYSSTKYVLTALKGHLAKDAIFMFDQITAGLSRRAHEGRAMQEFVDETQCQWEVIGRQKRDGAIFKINEIQGN